MGLTAAISPALISSCPPPHCPRPAPQPRPLLCSQIPGCKVASLVPGDRPISREQADRQGGYQWHNDPTLASESLGGHSLGPTWRRPPCRRLILDLPLSGPRVDASTHLSPTTSEHYKPQALDRGSQSTGSKFLAIRTTADNTFPGYPALSSRHHEPSLYKGKDPGIEGVAHHTRWAMRTLARVAGKKAEVSLLFLFSHVGSEAGAWVEPQGGKPQRGEPTWASPGLSAFS